MRLKFILTTKFVELAMISISSNSNKLRSIVEIYFKALSKMWISLKVIFLSEILEKKDRKYNLISWQKFAGFRDAIIERRQQDWHSFAKATVDRLQNRFGKIRIV